MENEENTDLIHKKASKDQLVTFFHFSVGTLSRYSLFLILMDTQSFSWSALALEQERQRRQEEEKMKQGKA